MLLVTLLAGLSGQERSFFDGAKPVDAAGLAKIAAFSAGQIGKQVGGGECSHLAVEALRVSGAHFERSDFGPDAPGPGDYVWGRLVGTATAGKPVGVQVGDILQFRSVRLRSGFGVALRPHHTAIVAQIDAAGHPMEVFEQNISTGAGAPDRTVQRRPLDLTTLVDGWIRVYQPLVRRDLPSRTVVTVVNHTANPVTVAVHVEGAASSTFLLGSAGSDAAHFTRWITASSRPRLVVGATSLPMEQTAGYAVASGRSGPTVQRLADPAQ
ncbi:hypothetical protein LBMAG53_35750 [Planctomycetota bacterium]|nr:hypothetical protein LBMAG53_35750 [Planctomycetota bacterium]